MRGPAQLAARSHETDAAHPVGRSAGRGVAQVGSAQTSSRPGRCGARRRRPPSRRSPPQQGEAHRQGAPRSAQRAPWRSQQGSHTGCAPPGRASPHARRRGEPAREQQSSQRCPPRWPRQPNGGHHLFRISCVPKDGNSLFKIKRKKRKDGNVVSSYTWRKQVDQCVEQ